MYNETTLLVKVVMPENAGDGIVSGDSPVRLASMNPTRASGDSGAIMLSDTAENLYIAYEVVAVVKDEETGKTHFSQLKWKRLGAVEDESESEETEEKTEEETEPQLVYEFMFESGDKFVAYAADEYPALDGDELQMLNDSSSGGLPDYSQASNGDVLAISSGEPTWTTPSGGGGGGVLVVHSDGEALDKNYSEIAYAIMNSGAIVIYGSEEDGEILQLYIQAIAEGYDDDDNKFYYVNVYSFATGSIAQYVSNTKTDVLHVMNT